MADDQQPPEDTAGPAGHRDATSAGGDSGGGEAPAGGSGAGRPAPGQPSHDQTREFDPFAEPDEPGPDRPEPGGPEPDAAEPDRPGDRTEAYPSGDQTAPLPGHGGWSGRAEVPRPGAGGEVREAVPAEWEQEEAGAGRPWWLPIAIAVVLLLGMLGFGVWLALGSDGQQPGTPAATTPVMPTTAPATTAAPTSAAPTTPASPTPSATSAAVPVRVPSLVRQDEATARAILDDIGLKAVTQTRESDTVPPGRVIGTDPKAGAHVPPGTTITLIIATAPPPTTPPSTQPTQGTSAPDTSG